MKYLFLLGFILVGCGEPEKQPPPKDMHVDRKFCISECRAHEFQNFHGEGHSWGAGSSSMTGLSQEKIFDRVTRECEKFYEKASCCKATSIIDSDNIQRIHSRYYGECK